MTILASENHYDEEHIDEEQAETNEIEEREFPVPFYDSITGTVLKDPVVDPNGDSYDKSSLTADSGIVYYPNRALKSLIEREMALNEKTMRGSLRRVDDALQRGWGRLSGQYKPLPESYYCPITCDLMVDPVITPDGISYERESIVKWIRVNGKSPVTRNKVLVSQLRPNNNLYDLIQSEKEKASESMHPSIRRWKESDMATTRPSPQGVVSAPNPRNPPVRIDNNNNYVTATTPASVITIPQQIRNDYHTNHTRSDDFQRLVERFWQGTAVLLLLTNGVLIIIVDLYPRDISPRIAGVLFFIINFFIILFWFMYVFDGNY